MKKLAIAGMLAAFATAVALPVVIGPQEAVAAPKKKSMTKMQKPSGRMCAVAAK